MDDFGKDRFRFDEIDQIQKQIDEDLKSATKAEKSSDEQTPTEQQASLPADTEKSPPIGDEFHIDVLSSRPTIETTSDYDLAHAGNVNNPGVGTRIVPAEQVEDPCQSFTGGNCPNNDFFKQTVKNETYRGKKKPFKRVALIALIVSVGGGLAGGIGLSIGGQIAANYFGGNGGQQVLAPPQEFHFPAAQSNEPKSVNVVNIDDATRADLNFADVVDIVEPSVAAVIARTETTASPRSFFGYPGDSYGSPSKGSGIIFDQDDGKVYIATNYHVIKDNSNYFVSIEGCDETPARVVGMNAESDLAVLSVLKSDLLEADIDHVTVATFGASDMMRTGDFVIAIGNALGEGNTATFGMVSATNKMISVEDNILTVIQTDAAINPGNSGGPLVNLKGEVVGINTVKLADYTVEGMGFSITSDVAMPIIEQLRNEITKPSLGIVGYNVTEKIAEAYSLPQLGVIVDSVVEGGNADKYGIKVNDIITSFDGQTVVDMTQLKEQIQECKIGDEVEVKIIRNNENLTLYVILEERNG